MDFSGFSLQQFVIGSLYGILITGIIIIIFAVCFIKKRLSYIMMILNSFYERGAFVKIDDCKPKELPFIRKMPSEETKKKISLKQKERWAKKKASTIAEAIND